MRSRAKLLVAFIFGVGAIAIVIDVSQKPAKPNAEEFINASDNVLPSDANKLSDAQVFSNSDPYLNTPIVVPTRLLNGQDKATPTPFKYPDPSASRYQEEMLIQAQRANDIAQESLDDKEMREMTPKQPDPITQYQQSQLLNVQQQQLGVLQQIQEQQEFPELYVRPQTNGLQ